MWPERYSDLTSSATTTKPLSLDIGAMIKPVVDAEKDAFKAEVDKIEEDIDDFETKFSKKNFLFKWDFKNYYDDVVYYMENKKYIAVLVIGIL